MFIIDEASMVPGHALSAIDRMLRDITKVDIPFGGKVFLLGGDFRQVLPVVPRKPRTVIVENCIKRSPLWPLIQVFKLTKNMCALENEKEFADWLLELGNRSLHCDVTDATSTSVTVPAQCNIVRGDLIDPVYPDMSNPREMATSVILTPTNESSLTLNEAVLAKIEGQSKIYYSADKAISDDAEEVDNYPIEFINSLTPTGMPPHKLTMKVGAIVMLLRNLDINRGLCNGSRLIVHRLHEYVIDAELLTGANIGQRVLIPRIKFAPSDLSLPFTLQRIQFLIRLCYSMTINKSQGQTFNKLGIYLEAPVFAHGQLYVAFSSCRSFGDIHVKIEQTTRQGPFQQHTFTQNVVYKEVL